MPLFGLIYGSTIEYIVYPFNMYIHFRHLKTHKAKTELVLKRTGVTLVYTVLKKGFKNERIKPVDSFVTEEL